MSTTPTSIPAIMAPPPRRDNPLTRSKAGLAGIVFLITMIAACVGTLPWTLSAAPGENVARYKAGETSQSRLPPWWWRDRAADAPAGETAAAGAARADAVTGFLGTDVLGRSLFVRVLAGGGISLGIGLAAAALSVAIGTLYGSIAAYAGGAVDAVMMRIVDVLYGLPYVLLVVLLAVASDAALDEYISRSHARAAHAERSAAALSAQRGLGADREAGRWLMESDPAVRTKVEDEARAALPPREIGEGTRSAYDVGVLLVAIGGVSWLTMARVVRGQVLSLKAQPFVEAARAMGVGWFGLFRRHLLPNLVGPVVVYATLTVPQAILQESFLSFLGIGVKPPLPSWGNLAAEGLSELNTYRSHWWLLVFPCVLLGATLLALNFVGEGLREALDPKRSRRG